MYNCNTFFCNPKPTRIIWCITERDPDQGRISKSICHRDSTCVEGKYDPIGEGVRIEISKWTSVPTYLFRTK